MTNLPVNLCIITYPKNRKFCFDFCLSFKVWVYFQSYLVRGFQVVRKKSGHLILVWNFEKAMKVFHVLLPF